MNKLEDLYRNLEQVCGPIDRIIGVSVCMLWSTKHPARPSIRFFFKADTAEKERIRLLHSAMWKLGWDPLKYSVMRHNVAWVQVSVPE